MDAQSLGMLAILGGGFGVGLWYIVARGDANLTMRQGMNAEGLRYGSGEPGFGNAKLQINAKLAVVEERRRARELARGRLAQLDAERNVQKQAAERSAKDVAENAREAERLRLAAIAEAQAEADLEAQRAEDEAERRRREREEGRLAEARMAQIDQMEADRQAELAAAEASRLDEIQTARDAEAIQSKQAAQAAMKDLQARLDREGARSSDVQVSLMWNNFNDLDLHIVCPSGERIHGGNKISKCGGELDVDANVRPESKKPVENVYWPEGTAPAGKYQVYVHHYKKHKKRRAKDPTKFQVIINSLNDEDNDGVPDVMEYKASLSHGDPIMLVATFEVPTMAERRRRKQALEDQLAALGRGEDVDVEPLATPQGSSAESTELLNELNERLQREGADSSFELPSAPDLDKLSDAESNQD
ncbi:MAG TPA: YfaP family protein [Candidatus Poseidoniaceae archaeon]|nr:YfaP family protein [Candidatus Poseidoniaceae archaeon]|tara:strand:- start:783 stop:2036 length:1254 start_codon:yes stop_codon:yes gene_type:complete